MHAAPTVPLDAPPLSQSRPLRRSYRRRGAGNTVDAILAIVLGAIVLGVVYANAGDGQNDVKSDQTYNDVMAIAQKVIKTYGVVDFTELGTLTATQVAQLDLAPSSMTKSGAAVNAYGQQVTVGVGTPATTFSVNSPGTAADGCIESAQRLSKVPMVSGVANTTTSRSFTRAASQFPLTAANALTLCGTAAAAFSVTFDP